MTTPAEVCPCNDETWDAFEKVRDAIVERPVRYGPGRGLWIAGKYVIGYSPGKLSQAADVNTWRNVLGKRFPSLHCTSWTNLFLSWLLRRNDLFTHGGNVPDLPELLGTDATMHIKPGQAQWRGFKGLVTAITPDGTGAARTGYANRIDAKELLDRARAESLPTFLVFSQSTKTRGGWNRDHHTGVYVARHARLYRIAADGYKNASGYYSATPMVWTEIADANVANFGAAAYQVWGIDTADGSYGDQSKPIAEVDFEAL